MKVFKLQENAEIPEFATSGSAAFDIKACLQSDTKIRCYNPHNREMFLPVRTSQDGRIYASLQPGFRSLVPTGLIFDIPRGYNIDVNIRSSVSFKNGLFLANGTALIDSDYVEETFVMIYNAGDTPINIYHGDRIAQGRLIKNETYKLEETKTRPGQKTERDGGIGSTGVSENEAQKQAPKKRGRPKKNS